MPLSRVRHFGIFSGSMGSRDRSEREELADRERAHKMDPRSGDPVKDMFDGEARESSFAEKNSPTIEEIDHADPHRNTFTHEKDAHDIAMGKTA